MKRGIYFQSNEEFIYNLKQKENQVRGTLIEAHISDIHFGALQPNIQYDILKEQFIQELYKLPKLDIISINGDLFDHKFMANSDAIYFASIFVNDLVELAKIKNSTIVIIHGTQLHDANQLKLFYHYIHDDTVDIRIVEHVRFEYIKGAKILCIPEINGLSMDYYKDFLYNSGEYDACFMHGTFEGAIYGAKVNEKEENKAPVFNMNHFKMCKGPIISGHVHIPGCFQKHFYYTGSPYTYKFGEDVTKGFYILLHNLDTQQYYINLQEIYSFIYRTINLDDMVSADPKEVINYINKLKEEQNIDNIRIEFSREDLDEYKSNLDILKSYYKNNSSVKINIENKAAIELKKTQAEFEEKYKQFMFINDTSLTEYEKLVMYINIKKGFKFITVDKLKELLEKEI